MSEPLSSSVQVTAEWLTEVLRRERRLRQGAVVGVETKQARELLVSHVFQLAVTYSSDASASAPSRLFLKISGSKLQPEFSRREVEFYNTAAREMDSPPLIRCYDAVYSGTTGGSHILLDDVSATHTQTQTPLPPAARDCELAIDCIAKLHAHWWSHPRLGRDIGKLTTGDEFDKLRATLARHLDGFLDFLGDRLSTERRRLYEKILGGSMHAWRRMLVREGLTLTHGDAHWWNFLYPRAQGEGEALIFDWHLWHVDVPLKDLAFMLAFNWYPQRRAAMEQNLLRRYHRSIVEQGVRNYGWDDCWLDYRGQVVRKLFVPVWQWSSGMPPGIWWSNLEKIWLAFDDLGCAELLD